MFLKVLKGVIGIAFCISQVSTADSMLEGHSTKAQLVKISAYRPSDWTHLYYAVQAYQENPEQILSGWKLIHVYFEKNGY